MKLKVFYDHQIFSIQNIGGISRYFYEIISRNNNCILSSIYNENIYLSGKKKHVRFCGKEKIIRNLNNLYTLLMLKFSKYDIFHPTYYDDYFMGANKKTLIITVYDMIHEIFEGIYFSENNDTIRKKRELCEKADGIIAISETTKKDIIRILGIKPEKIKVIYLGTNLKKIEKKIKLPKRYILFVGSRGLYKNFEKFLSAISSILIENYSLELLCIGIEFNNKEMKLLDEFGVSHKVKAYLADEDEMYTIYKNAEIFVFPSLYEGFGIPILEAYESQCPVVLSNIECFREVAGEAGIYFDAGDCYDIKEKVEMVINSKELRNRLINLGNKRLQKFSWEKTYIETYKFYEKFTKDI